MAKRAAQRLLVVRAFWVGAALLGGCSKGAASTPVSQAPDVANEAESAKQPQPETNEKPASQSETSETPAKPRPGTDDPCPTICSRTIALKCGPLDECLRGCAEMRSTDKCGLELDGFLRCSAARPIEYWECDPETGTAAIKDGNCDAEQTAVVDCLRRAG